MNQTERTQSQPAEPGVTEAPLGCPAFDFHRDTFAFANETKWRYSVDPATGRQVSVPRESEPDYTLHCFVVVRAARQFWLHARFEPVLPKPDEMTCRRLRAAGNHGPNQTSARRLVRFGPHRLDPRVLPELPRCAHHHKQCSV